MIEIYDRAAEIDTDRARLPEKLIERPQRERLEAWHNDTYQRHTNHNRLYLSSRFDPGGYCTEHTSENDIILKNSQIWYHYLVTEVHVALLFQIQITGGEKYRI